MDLKYIILNIIYTLLRIFPVRCKTGLVRIGNPAGDSPVFLTCNYHLTVMRVIRALRHTDCYLLVANSRGYNVWCGAAGGHFTDHNIISVLKTSGIEKLIDHRKVILPQLAAAGIEAGAVRRKTGWTVIWGPVYIEDIDAFIKNGHKKTSGMKEVRFPISQRAEMAVMWAFPFSVITTLVTLPFWPGLALPVAGLIWGLSLLFFISFPLYSRWLDQQTRGMGFSRFMAVFDIGPVLLVMWATSVLGIFIYIMSSGIFSWNLMLKWGFVSLVILLILSIDLKGSTPVYKSGLHEERFLHVAIDKEKCRGTGICTQVCPRNCFSMDRKLHIAVMDRPGLCVRCGACIVQCPFDALFFEDNKDNIIPPDAIRIFKLNLSGKRLISSKKRNDKKR